MQPKFEIHPFEIQNLSIRNPLKRASFFVNLRSLLRIFLIIIYFTHV
jgi:hypothetical protein